MREIKVKEPVTGHAARILVDVAEGDPGTVRLEMEALGKVVHLDQAALALLGEALGEHWIPRHLGPGDLVDPAPAPEIVYPGDLGINAPPSTVNPEADGVEAPAPPTEEEVGTQEPKRSHHKK